MLEVKLEKSVKFFKTKGLRNPIADNYPRNIGLSVPANIYDYEFLICGKNVPYTQNQIINVFVEHGAMLQSLDSSIDAIQERFVLSLCCNLEHADVAPFELVVKLQSMKFVISAEYSEIRGRLFGRKQAGIAFNNKQSAVALRSSTLVNLGKRLARELGSLGTSVLYEEGRDYAHGIVQELGQILNQGEEPDYSFNYSNEDAVFSDQPKVEAYCVRCRATRPILNPKQVLLSNKSNALQGTCPVCSTKVFKIGGKIYGKIKTNPVIENAQAFLMATGWGAFELRTEVAGRCGEVTISDPPMQEVGYDHFGNQFIEGIAAGLLEAASGIRNRMAIVGQKYDRDNRTLCLHFAEQIPVRRAPRRRISSRATAKVPAIESKPPEAKAVSVTPEQATTEVDRIISALEKIESDARTSEEKEGEERSQLVAEPVASQNSADS